MRCLLPGLLTADNGSQAASVGEVGVQRGSVFKDLRLPRQMQTQRDKTGIQFLTGIYFGDLARQLGQKVHP